MKNDRLSYHGLVHIHLDFEADVYKVLEVYMFVSAKTQSADFGQFQEILVYQSH